MCQTQILAMSKKPKIIKIKKKKFAKTVIFNVFNKRKLVLELLNVVKVKVIVKVTMKKFRNRFLLPELLDDL